jgi:tetratricopeptide (TPR) repeat protein
MIRKTIIILLLWGFLSLLLYFVLIEKNPTAVPLQPQIANTPTPTPSLAPLPPSKLLNNDYHIFQSFNNCGPAALSMALSYYDIRVSQGELGQSLRPYQNALGDNDDKSVTLAELATKAKEYNLVPFHRPNGTPEILKYFLAHDMPVITRTWLKTDDDIGHYRVVKGYDDTRQEFVQDDSLQGKNIHYPYEEFNELWEKFNFEYLVLVPEDKVETIRAVLGENADEQKSWQNAVDAINARLANNPDNIYERFNLSVALYHTGEYEKSIEEFEKVESRLPFRTLWYQIEPILSYYETGNYERVLSITERILNNQNRAFSELYVLRGKIYQEQGLTDAARNEYQNAVLYNGNLKEAQDALNSL